MANTKKPEQLIEILITDALTFPEIASAALEGKAVTITLTGATVTGYSALVGSPQNTTNSPRPSQRAGKDHVTIRISASAAAIAEDTTPPEAEETEM
jgi:hypothetical protein